MTNRHPHGDGSTKECVIPTCQSHMYIVKNIQNSNCNYNNVDAMGSMMLKHAW